MTKAPACCTPDTTIDEVARTMLTQDCGCVPVCESSESHRVIGIVTDRDIALRGVASGRNSATIVAKDVMSHPVVFSQADETLDQLLKTMEENQIRRVMVNDGYGQLVGLVSLADISRKLSSQEAAEVLKRISEAGDIGHS